MRQQKTAVPGNAQEIEIHSGIFRCRLHDYGRHTDGRVVQPGHREFQSVKGQVFLDCRKAGNEDDYRSQNEWCPSIESFKN